MNRPVAAAGNAAPDQPSAPDDLAAVADQAASAGVRVEWAGPGGEPVVTITLDRPDVRNAQTPSMWRALAAVGRVLPAGSRIVVLRAAGPAFSAGLDLRMFGEGVPGEGSLAEVGRLDHAAADFLIEQFQEAFTWWADADVVTIAVVQGAAVGAGFQLALACDLLVCTEQARFAMREPTLGLVPDLGGTYPLVRDVGYRRALELCLTGRWVDAREAQSLGLALQVVPPGEEQAALDRLVGALLAAPDASVRATRRLLRDAGERTVAAQRAAERHEQYELLRGLVAGAG